MISAINEIETAVQAMKHGAYHYINKDFDTTSCARWFATPASGRISTVGS
jgi:DNA-binding NtrC family response regulator